MDVKRARQILSDDEERLSFAAFKGLKILDGNEDDLKAQGWFRVGFDSEFTNDGQTVISYQLWGEDGRGTVINGPKRLDLKEIVHAASELAGDSPSRVILISYFNTAELSQLTTPFWEERNVSFYQVHPRGIFHVKGFTESSDGRNIEFFYFDLWHFFASMREGSSLYNVAERFGYRKLDYDVTNLSLNNLNDPLFVEYGLNDAKITLEIFQVLEDTYKRVNNVSIIARDTPAAAAMASFRRNYLIADVKAPALYIRNLALASDWAGRVECGYIGEYNAVHDFDADSLYPRSALLLGNLPAPLQWKIGIPDDLNGTEGFIDVQFAFPSYEEWPCLPVFNESTLYFPLQGRSICTLGELRAALSRGVRLQKIYRCCYYRNGQHGEFSRFIDDNLELKTSAGDNEALRAIAKLNMNSGIGKFIQNKGGTDYDEITKYINNNYDKLLVGDIGRLFGGSLVISGYNFHQGVKIGSGFYPEWHSLILGKSREIMAYAIYNSLAYPKILMISTDSLHVPTCELGPTLVKFKHEFGPVFFKSIRCRVHIAKDGDKIVKIAQHGMPMGRDEAAHLILESKHHEDVDVDFTGRKTLREAARSADRLFAEKPRHLRINLRPDTKRVLSDNGYTHPLRAVV